MIYNRADLDAALQWIGSIGSYDPKDRLDPPYSNVVRYRGHIIVCYSGFLEWRVWVDDLSIPHNMELHQHLLVAPWVVDEIKKEQQ